MIEAQREQTRIELSDEIRKKIKAQLEQKNEWSDDCEKSINAARSSGKRLLIVIDSENGPGNFREADLSVDELQAGLFEPFQRCRIDATSIAGKKLLKRYCARVLPAIVVIDPDYPGALSRFSGQMTFQQWAMFLVENGRCGTCR